MEYGYIRVSSKDQNEDRQRLAMREQGIRERQIYLDRQSGKDFKRSGYLRLMRRLRGGDLLVVKSIDRLGRNYEEIMEQWRYVTRELGADIFVLDMPLLDTRRGKDLLGTFIADLVLQVLSFVAENERANIRQRQAEGIAAAKLRGVRFGRPAYALPEAFEDIAAQYEQGELTARQAAEALGVCANTFLKYYRIRNGNEAKVPGFGGKMQKNQFQDAQH